MRSIAFFFFGILHPFLIPLYVLFLIFNTGSVFAAAPNYTRFFAYLLTFVGPILVPLLCMLLLKSLRLITSYRLQRSQEQLYPVLLTIICTFIVFYLVGGLPYANIIRQFYLVMIILLSGFILLSIRWKVSLQMTALGALCGFVFILGYKYFGDVVLVLSGLLLLTGIVGAARIYLRQHTPPQIYGGFLYGVFLVVALLF